MPFVTASDGVALHYAVIGQGPAIVLVHGWAMNGSFFRKNVPSLGERFRVITVDSRGHGLSGKDLVHLTMEQLADDLEAVLAALDVHDAVLAGWSAGMATVYTYLSRHGTARVAGLASIDMTAKVLNDDGWEHGAFGTLDTEEVLALERQITLDRAGFSGGFVPAMFASGSVPPPEDVEWMLDQSMNVPDLAVLALLVSFASQDWRELLSRIEVPVLFMHGTRSQIYPSRLWEPMARLASDGRVALFDAGHLIFWERPEEFNETLSTFVDEVTARADA